MMIMQRCWRFPSHVEGEYVAIPIYFRAVAQARPAHASLSMRLALNFAAIVIQIVIEIMIMQRSFGFCHAQEENVWQFHILSRRGATRGQAV